jgi:serine/threonine protein kinase
LARVEHRAPPPRFLQGERVAGRFRIVRFLGQGGMAQVYEAEDLEVGQRVAIKALRPRLARDERALRRFRAEVLLARKVTHPNVCRIFDVFQHGEGLVLSMELLEGETLRDRLRRGPLSPEEALPLVRQMAEALDAAHRAGVAHLDFKSANAMLVPSASPAEGPRAVVTDFGLARSSDMGEGRSPMVGTPAYMAPEQVRGEEATAAADLYALGVVLYEMVTGDLPFQGETPWETAHKRLEEPPPRPRARVPGLPLVWDEVVLRCLRPEASLRFGTAGEVAAALGGPFRRPASFAWRRAAAVLVPLVLAAAVLASAPLNPPPSRSALLYSQGLAELRASNPREALGFLSEAVRLDPGSALARSSLAEAWMELGYQRRGRGESRKAFELSRRLPQRDRLAVEARYYEHHFRWDAAIERYTALSTLFPGEIEYGLRLVMAHVEAGQGHDALRSLQSLRKLSDSEDPRIDLAEAQVAETLSDSKSQLLNAQRAIEKGEDRGFRQIVARGYQYAGEARRHIGDFDQAKEDQQRARAMFVQMGDEGGAAESLWRLAVVHMRLQADPKALKALAQALSEFRRIGHRAGEAKALRTRALLARRSSEWEKIESFLRESLAIFNEVGDRQGQARVRSDLGEYFLMRGRYAEAREQLDAALPLTRQLGDQLAEASTLISLGEITAQRDPSDGLRLLRQALSICERIGNLPCQNLALRVLGSTLNQAGEFAEAQRALSLGQRLAATQGFKLLRVRCTLELARNAYYQGNFRESEIQSRRSAAAFLAGNHWAASAFSHIALAQALTAQGKLEESREAWRKAETLLLRATPEQAIDCVAFDATVLKDLASRERGRPTVLAAAAEAQRSESIPLRLGAAIGLAALRSACTELPALEGEARGRGFVLLARKAAEAHSECVSR